MAEDSKTEGRTLAEALLAWGDPAAVAEMTRLAKDGYDGPMIICLDGPKDEDERKAFRYRELRERLERELIEKLIQGSLVATGYDSRTPVDASASAVRGDRWRVLTANFENSSATAAGMTITGVLVYEAATAPSAGDPRPRLQIGRTTRQVWLDGTDLRLTPRSFNLLLVLAEAAATGGAPVSGGDIEACLWSGYVDKKAVNDAVGKLKAELETQGVIKAADCPLIINYRAIGYQLTLAPSEVQILD